LSVFCRHNRFIADCPICSKGTALDPKRQAAGRRQSRGGARKPSAAKAPAFSGPHAAAGPYRDHDDVRYLVRLEKVPGGIRLAEWAGSQLRRRAPVLPAEDLPGLLGDTAGVLSDREAAELTEALSEAPGGGVSRGRSGDFQEELRVDDVEDGKIRVARWVLRPGSDWELQDAPVMVPVARLAEALRGVVSSR
jgi:hypothetical protein